MIVGKNELYRLNDKCFDDDIDREQAIQNFCNDKNCAYITSIWKSYIECKDYMQGYEMLKVIVGGIQ
jgi:hypothetical protein